MSTSLNELPETAVNILRHNARVKEVIKLRSIVRNDLAKAIAIAHENDPNGMTLRAIAALANMNLSRVARLERLGKELLAKEKAA